MKRVTLADVAALAGVSSTAASLVLNDRPGSRLSDDARLRIQAAAAELGYRPDPAARSLRLGKTRTIGFVSYDVTITRYAMEMVRGALDEAERLEHTVLIAETGNSPDRATKALDAMLDRRVDAVVIAQMGAKQFDVPRRLPKGLPVVLVNATSSDDHPSVLPDELVAGEQVATVLLQAGHARIALLGIDDSLRAPRASATIGSRYDGIYAALSGAGIEPVAIANGARWEPTEGYAMMHQLLDGPLFTGVVCLNDRLAFGAYEACRERGVRIPEDLSVVSFDDDVVATYVRPRLTTAEIPYERMGRVAVKMALGELEPAHQLVPMPVKLRDSVVPPATA